MQPAPHPLSQFKEGDANKIFYADDGSSGGKLDKLHVWWEDLKQKGPLLGYFPNAPKTWLVVKPEHIGRAKELFPDINITTEGKKILGSFIGNHTATMEFVRGQVEEWRQDIDALSRIAKSEPQLAYSAYVTGTSRRWQFLSRTTPNVSEPLKLVEEDIRMKLIPAILGGKQVTDDMRSIFSLPAREGGMGIQIPSDDSNFEYENSILMNAQLTEAIYRQDRCLVIDEEEMAEARSNVRKRKSERYSDLKDHLKVNICNSLFKMLELATEKGASIWLTCLPLKDLGFRLNKQNFVDAICLRYDLPLTDVPKKCFCGNDYSINHCLTCKNGGFVIMRHNAIRDTTHEILNQVCNDVRLEPALLPVTGEDLPPGTNIKDGARADVSALGIWMPLSRAFFDIKVFNPLARTNWQMDIDKMYSHHEEVKKREYAARILQVEKGTFTPVIFSCTGGCGPEATAFIKQLALKLSLKKQERYSETVSFIRRRFSFDIIRTCVISLRGERKKRHHVDEVETIADLDIELSKME